MIDKRYQGKNILVLGLGKSGLSAGQLLSLAGGEVDFYDEKKASSAQLKDLPSFARRFYFADDWPVLDEAAYHLCVVSPGIPLDRPLIKELRKKKVEVVGEMQLALNFFPYPYLAITGTNGKTTTTRLIHHILELAGRRPLLAGNIGRPLSGQLVQMSKERDINEGDKKEQGSGIGTGTGIGVFEVSSYQLETLTSFSPHLALLTNLSPDHMDRHQTMDNYLKIKSRIFKGQGPEDTAVLNQSLMGADLGPLAGQVLYFSSQGPVRGAYLEEGKLIYEVKEKEVIIEAAKLKIQGLHNVENALAAICLAKALSVDRRIIRQGLESFSGVEHRQEEVRALRGVRYINDSKATNVNSAIKALESYSGRVFILLGGSYKKTDYGPLARSVYEKNALALVCGDTRQALGQALDAAGANWQEKEDLAACLYQAQSLAQPGDIVLLSPACPSFDAFKNFEDRGNFFKELVHGLD